LASLDDLGDGHFRQTYKFYLALAPHVLKLADLICRWNVRVDAVNLIQINPFQFEPPEAHLDTLAQIFWPPKRMPLIWPGPEQSTLRRDRYPFVRVEALGNQFLSDKRAVRVSCIDEVNAEFDGAAQDRDCGSRVDGLPPHSSTSKPVSPQSESRDGALATERECGACRSLSLIMLHGSNISINAAR
jgi:hypothetical protein